MTPFWIGIILIAGGIAFAAAPLLRRRQRGADTDERSVEPRWMSPPERQVQGVIPSQGDQPRIEATPMVAAALEELELDRAMGKMSEGDYRELRASLERDARATDPTPSTAPPAEGSWTSDDVPPEVAPAAAIAAPSARSGRDTGEEAERLVRSFRVNVTSCPDCGPRPEPHAAYCSNCGMALLACPQCAHTIAQPGARFCDRCGSALAR